MKHETEARDSRVSLPQRPVRPSRPIQERGPIVRARERGGRGFERSYRVRVVTFPVTPPTGLPGRPLGPGAGRELLVELGEDLRSRFVLVRDDEMGAEVVEGLLRPGVAREIAQEPARLGDVLVVVAELAQRRQIKEPGLRLARGALQIGPRALTRAVVAPQVEIAFRHSQIDELPIVAVRDTLEFLERGARLRVAPRAKQHHGPTQIRLIARLDDLVLQRLQLRCGSRCGIGQRELVVETHVRLRRGLAIVGGDGGASEPREHFVRDQRLGVGEALIDVDRVPVFPRGLGGFPLRKGGHQRHGSLRLAVDNGGERLLRFLILLQAELRETGVVVDVVVQRWRRREAGERGQGAREIVVPVTAHCSGERGRGRADPHRTIRNRRHQPQIAFVPRECLMLGGRERFLPLRGRAQTSDEEAGDGKSSERAGLHAELPRSVASPSASVCTSSC